MKKKINLVNKISGNFIKIQAKHLNKYKIIKHTLTVDICICITKLILILSFKLLRTKQKYNTKNILIMYEFLSLGWQLVYR